MAAIAVAAAAPAGWIGRLPGSVPAPAVPVDNPMTAAKIELGRRLFYDADLSVDGTMSCASCHEQRHGFTDGNAGHPGVHGDPARRNVPGLANVAWLPSYTWGNPRIRSLEAQAMVPIFGTNPVEMGMRGMETELVRRLAADDCYRRMFAAAFPASGGRIDIRAVTRALAAFERTLVSFGARYDQEGSLDPQARRGAALFRAACASCHSGRDFTDGRFHRILPPAASDRGLGEITGRKDDDGKFRTPGLRNVAVTQPYFHDGSAKTIADAIARHPGRRPPADIAALTAFLATLTDEKFLTDPRFGLPDRACGKAL
ncbi:cytochrome-c peroxidase [Sphingomonas sp. CL5.1]|nr:cytochrome-c peroxidase [Sphingomonas sp. CL5.1]